MSETRIKDAPIVLRLTADQKQLYKSAAEKEGYRELSPWIRKELDGRAQEILEPTKKAARGKKGIK